MCWMHVSCVIMVFDSAQCRHQVPHRICFATFVNIGGRFSTNFRWVQDGNGVELYYSLEILSAAFLAFFCIARVPALYSLDEGVCQCDNSRVTGDGFRDWINRHRWAQHLLDNALDQRLQVCWKMATDSVILGYEGFKHQLGHLLFEVEQDAGNCVVRDLTSLLIRDTCIFFYYKL